MTALFRQEAVDHAARRLEGDVVVATPPTVPLLGGVFCSILFAAVGFAALATYSRTSNVSGWLLPDQGLIRATSQTTGLVRSVFVQEGSAVNEGDRIAEINVSAQIAGGNAGDEISKGLRTEEVSIKAKGQASVAKLKAEAGQISRRIEAQVAEMTQATSQLALLKDKLKLAKELVEQSAGLMAKGYMPKKDFDARRQAALQAEIDATQQSRQINSLERDIADARARLQTIPLEIDATRAESGSAEAGLTQRKVDAEAKRTLFIVAPISGKIAALPVTVGQHLPAGTTTAIIVPIDGRLEAELLVPTRASGFIRVGQDVRLMLQAFPHQRFGTVPGTVKSISSTVLGPNEISIPGIVMQEPVFRLRVSLSREHVQAYGEKIGLQPGMLVNAEIVFDRRTLVQWLFDPIYAMRGRS